MGFGSGALKFSPGQRSNMMPEPGTTEQALLILLALEIAGLILLRRYFARAHGG